MLHFGLELTATPENHSPSTTTMVNLPAQGMKALGVALELEGASNDALVRVFDEMKHVRSFINTDSAFAAPWQPAGDLSVRDLPLLPTMVGRTGPLKTAVEIMTGIDVPMPDRTVLAKIMKDNAYKDLPEPLCPKESTGDILYTMGLSVLQESPDKFTIIKSYKFEKQLSVDLIERTA